MNSPIQLGAKRVLRYGLQQTALTQPHPGDRRTTTQRPPPFLFFPFPTWAVSAYSRLTSRPKNLAFIQSMQTKTLLRMLKHMLR